MNDTDGEKKESKAQTKRRGKWQERQDKRIRVTVKGINPEMLMWALDRVLEYGGAVRIGTTRDHGAYAFGIYGDGGEPYTEYVRPDEDVNEFLDNLGEHFNDLIDEADGRGNET